MTAITLTFPPSLALTDEAFFQLCQRNSDVRFERTASGELIVMSPVGGEGGKREADLTFELVSWNRQSDLGVVFSPSSGFKLPNGADRSPDAAWVEQSRWDALTPEQRRRFLPIAPDFVIELRSETDSLTTLQTKMREYIDNGVRLGWLINPQDKQVEVYRPEQPIEILANPSSLSGEAVLPGFLLSLSRLL
ncbi:MAG: hypothetical protein DCF17_06575 [Shackletoniella antarctica]|uniref:Putative restriction endonuclease domain-containing protein n=1 Tax=Shackletoniella antarctica TaxID=268115 RepID=A0A2W4WIU7_9CYAN|nr:MAG: hypothetical protein DCF17_06575 [Shackletoniella antarctica]